MTATQGQRHVAIYTRISHDRTQDSAAVERQEHDCRAYLTSLQERGTIPEGVSVRVYCDNDISAYQLKRPREAFEEMLADVESGRVEAIVAFHQDRLYRRTKDMHRVASLFASQAHLTVQTVKSGLIDFSTPASKLAAHMLVGISEYEIENKSLRQQATSDSLARAGQPWAGRRPFGYEKDRATVRDSEAEQVRQGVDHLLAGGSLTTLIREWNSTGLPPVLGGKWRHSSVQAVLTRWRNVAIRQHRGAPFGPAQWQAIVSSEKHEQVVALLADTARRTNQEKVPRRHLLSFILRCGRCSEPLRAGSTGSRGRSYAIYQCTGLNGCRIAISYDVAEAAVKTFIRHRLTTPDPSLLAETQRGRNELAELQQERARLSMEERVIEELSDIGLDSKVRMLRTIHLRRQEIDDEIEAIRRRVALASLVLAQSAPGRQDLDAVASQAEDAMQRFDLLDLHVRRRIVKALCSVRVMPAEPGVSYKNGRSYERVWIQPLDPATGEPTGEFEQCEAPGRLA